MKKTVKYQKPVPKFSGGLLVDSFTKGDNNKINAQGVFSVFWAWGYPAQRRCAAIFDVTNLPSDVSTLLFSVRRRRQTTQTTIGFLDLENKDNEPILIVPAPLGFQFAQEGHYELICQIKNTKCSTIIPFEVRTREWPIFTENEIELARQGKIPIINMRANIHCQDCSHVYIFEETVLPDKAPLSGVVRFPDSGIFPCNKCDHDLNLKDIQGQLRATLKDLLKKYVGGL